MTAAAIRAGLETALKAMTPPLDTAWENVDFEPTPGEPYQKVNVLFARPDNPEVGRNYMQRGFMQVTLMYPIGKGPGAAQTRAEAIRSAFYRTRALTASGVTTTIEFTPEIMPGFRDGDRYAVPVRVPFFADIIAA